MRNILLSILILAMAPAFLQAAQNRTGRPLHYISTDKQIYHPGETVYVRAVVLDGMTNYPLNDFLTGYTDFEWNFGAWTASPSARENFTTAVTSSPGR